MTNFTSLNINMQYALTGLVFLASLFVFLLFIYMYLSTRKFRKCILPAILFVISLVFISYISGSYLNKRYNYYINIPYIYILLISIVLICCSIISFIFTYKSNMRRISPNSIKEALDNLNTGICFYDYNGRIVLINYTMANLISSVIGSYPQSANEIQETTSKCLSIGDGMYRFPNGKLYLVSTSPLEDE